MKNKNEKELDNKIQTSRQSRRAFLRKRHHTCKTVQLHLEIRKQTTKKQEQKQNCKNTFEPTLHPKHQNWRNNSVLFTIWKKNKRHNQTKHKQKNKQITKTTHGWPKLWCTSQGSYHNTRFSEGFWKVFFQKGFSEEGLRKVLPRPFAENDRLDVCTIKTRTSADLMSLPHSKTWDRPRPAQGPPGKNPGTFRKESRKSPRSTRKSAPRSLKRVRKSGFRLFSDSFWDSGAHSFGWLQGPASGDCFRTLFGLFRGSGREGPGDPVWGGADPHSKAAIVNLTRHAWMMSVMLLQTGRWNVSSQNPDNPWPWIKGVRVHPLSWRGAPSSCVHYYMLEMQT